MELQQKILIINFKIMKQLKKLKLKDFSEMSDAEMKFVVGGSGIGSGVDASGSYTCDHYTCDGTCSPKKTCKSYIDSLGVSTCGCKEKE